MGEHEEKNRSAGFRRFLEKVGRTLGVLFVLFVGWIVVVTVLTPMYTKYLERSREARYQEELNAHIAEQKADVFGGKTPEETFDLLIEALKNNDAELASKYYVLEKQEKALTDFQEELAKEGDLHLSIIYFTDVSEKGEKVCHDLDNNEKAGCNFEYQYITDKDETLTIKGSNNTVFVPKGSLETEFVDLNPNPYTNLWKITQ